MSPEEVGFILMGPSSQCNSSGIWVWTHRLTHEQCHPLTNVASIDEIKNIGWLFNCHWVGAPFAVKTIAVLCGKDLSKCYKHSFNISIHVDMIAHLSAAHLCYKSLVSSRPEVALLVQIWTTESTLCSPTCSLEQVVTQCINMLEVHSLGCGIQKMTDW